MKITNNVKNNYHFKIARNFVALFFPVVSDELYLTESDGRCIIKF